MIKRRKYAIKFSGPVCQNIWWMDFYHNKILTFDNANDAYRWSDDAYTRFPHCKYLVMEISREQEEKEKPF